MHRSLEVFQSRTHTISRIPNDNKPFFSKRVKAPRIVGPSFEQSLQRLQYRLQCVNGVFIRGPRTLFLSMPSQSLNVSII